MIGKEHDVLLEWTDAARELIIEKKYDEAIELTEKYWNNVLEPKMEQEISFHLIKVFVFLFSKKEDYESAIKWCEIFDKYDFENSGRPDTGEKDFLIGKVYYNCGKIDVAIEYFKIADKKSKGRCFLLDEGKEYKAIYMKEMVKMKQN